MIDLTHSESNSSTQPSFIISIDVGTRNLGFAVAQLNAPDRSARLVHLHNENIVNTSKYEFRYNVKYVKEFVDSHSHFFDNACCVVIERQNMSTLNMQIIETIFHTLFYEKVIFVNASHVKDHFFTPSLRSESEPTPKKSRTQKYTQNKQNAVKYVTEVLSNAYKNSNSIHSGNYAIHIPDPIIEHYMNGSKKDDMADAFMMMLYQLNRM